jgi:hypothetical protein
MARKKPTPKPLLAVKHDFVDSLDEFLTKAIFLQQVVRQALDLGCIKNDAIADMVQARLIEFERALLSDIGGDDDGEK